MREWALNSNDKKCLFFDVYDKCSKNKSMNT